MTKFLSVVSLLLLFSAPTLAQQLVPQDDSKDPCRQFKMRVLVPPNHDREMVVQPSDSIDRKMIWNPCQPAGLEVATLVPNRNPTGKKNFVIVEAGPFLPLKNSPIKPAPFVVLKPTAAVP